MGRHAIVATIVTTYHHRVGIIQLKATNPDAENNKARRYKHRRDYGTGKPGWVQMSPRRIATATALARSLAPSFW